MHSYTLCNTHIYGVPGQTVDRANASRTCSLDNDIDANLHATLTTTTTHTFGGRARLVGKHILSHFEGFEAFRFCCALSNYITFPMPAATVAALSKKIPFPETENPSSCARTMSHMGSCGMRACALMHWIPVHKRISASTSSHYHHRQTPCVGFTQPMRYVSIPIVYVDTYEHIMYD